MGHIKKLVLLTLSPLMVSAEWGMLVERAGFKGQTALGGLYRWNDRHSTEVSVGEYVVRSQSQLQLNLGHRYDPWRVSIYRTIWHPGHLGLYALASENQPDDYEWKGTYPPYRDYYDQNTLRLGLQLGTAFSWDQENWFVTVHMMVLDNGLGAIWNNRGEDLRYFLSSGVGLQYRF